MDASALNDFLEPIAAWFRSFNLPEPIVHWGHPLMMAIVVFAMGSAVGIAGWRIRMSTDGEQVEAGRSKHRQLAPWLFLFLATGYTGGVLSLVMQKQPILDSPHFWTGTAVVLLLAANGLISATKFGGNRASLRTAHAYLGSVALGLLLIHAVLGLRLGLSI